VSAVTGYLHPGYAESLGEFGAPRGLPESGGWLLERPIPGSGDRDATGCYPLFTCQDWTRLGRDLDGLADRLVSVGLVADPFGQYEVADLERCFPDRFFRFKEHHVIDLGRPPHSYVSAHHQRNARKALDQLQVEGSDVPPAAEEWERLYSTLIERHSITGISAFSRQAFARQFSVPGLVAFRAISEGETVGMLLWYLQDGVGYYHLGAYSPQGYELRASFALFWKAIHYFAESGLGWLNLGSGAGLGGGDEDGLSRFKRGWATGTRPAWFCGRILNREKYDELVRAHGVTGDDYFPLYRRGEFR